MSAPRRCRVAVYGEIDPNLVDGSAIWLQSICLVLASLAGVEVTLLLRRPLEPRRRHLLAELEAEPSIEVLDAGSSALLGPTEAFELLEGLDRSRNFDVVLLRGQAVLEEVVRRGGFDGRLWSYAMPGSGMADETLRALAGRSARLLCQTEAAAEELRALVPGAADRLLVVPPMVPDVVRPAAPPRAGKVPLRLVYSGKLSPQYCWLETVEAFTALREARPGTELHVLGDKIHRPPDRPEFHEQARRALRETEGLRWHGAVPRAAVPGVLAGCDLALSVRDPRVEAARELSTKVLEYGAAGLPVVLNRAPSYEQLLGEDYPLFVGDPGDTSRLLLGPGSDPAPRAAAAAACHAASLDFTFDRLATRLADHLSWRPAAGVAASGPGPSPGEGGVESAPPLLIGTVLGVGVKDRAWLEHRLALTSAITAPSLMAQHDQNFLWAVFVDPDMPATARATLERILAPFEGRAFLEPGRGHMASRLLDLARERGATDAAGRALTGRIDDDDAWSRRVVGMARDRAGAWIGGRRQALGVGFTFERGLEWVMYDMVDVDLLQRKGEKVSREATVRPYTFPFLGTSVFVLSSAAASVSAMSAGHARMGEVLAEKGFDVDVIGAERPMWLYCRHKQAESSIQKARSVGVEMTLADLAREFGIDEGRTARYLADAGSYGYAVVKRIKRFRQPLERELEQVKRQLDDPATADAQRAGLQRRSAELTAEVLQMSENVVGELE
jgi:hypothetical protein